VVPNFDHWIDEMATSAVVISLKRLSNWYTNLGEKFPVFTHVFTSMGLFVAGDAIYQLMEKKEKFDIPRMARMAVDGGFCLGFVGGYWYHFLDHRIESEKPKALITGAVAEIAKVDLRTIFKKVALDQLCFAPLFYVGFYALMPLLERKTPKESIDNVKKNWLHTYAMDMAFWPAAQYVNFRYFPTQQRVLFVSALCIPWNAFLSSMQFGH